jgi:tetratricopeptide (TPR) repeat protein
MLGLVKDGEQAIAAAQEAGAIAPKLARLRLYLQSWKGAQGALAAARALDRERKGPQARDARLAIAAADAWRRAGDPRRAIGAYSTALFSDPLHANLGLGRVSLAQGDFGQAEASFRAALEAHARAPHGVDDQTEARVGLARALVAKKSFQEAIATLTPSLAADPGAPEPHYWLARAYAERKEEAKARAEADKAIELDDAYADALLLVGDLNKTADPTRAKKAYKRYLELAPDRAPAKNVRKWLASAPKEPEPNLK